MTTIYIVDTETTGLAGANNNEKVVEIGICKLDTETKVIQKVYDSIVGQKLSEFEKDAWVFNNSDLTPEMVENGPPMKAVIDFVSELLENELVTAFNTGFDFRLFLNLPPWTIPYKKLMPCIMLSATQPCAIPNAYGYKWPSLDEAHSMLVNGHQEENGKPHRAMADSLKSAQILRSLIESKNYNLKVSLRFS